jgi:UMF1 family MFS transporter
MSTLSVTQYPADPKEYNRRIWAWTMYDWANSAFATTILAAVLPIYFSQVAGSTLPTAARATSIWSLGLSISLLIIAILSPILGTISDIVRGKKKLLAFFAGLGILGTALLVLVESGDWMLASILAIIGRIGFNGANVFYDALLAHVARPEDQDRVSARGYAMGYLGGGLLLAINVVMIQLLPGTWGARLSFLSVAIWWLIFTIPLLRWVPEPPAAALKVERFGELISESFARLGKTLRDIRQYRQLFKYLLAFLIYNDGIGTIIGVAAIYGAELGFGSVELILALLLVQFVGIPYSLIFGRLPTAGDRRRPIFLAFILFNLIALPILGVAGARVLPAEMVGAPPPPFQSTPTAVGEGVFTPQSEAVKLIGDWTIETIPARQAGLDKDLVYAKAKDSTARVEMRFNGQKVRLTHSTGPDHGIWNVLLDGQPYLDPDTGKPLEIDAYSLAYRYDVSRVIVAASPGEHVLEIVNAGKKYPASHAILISLVSIEVLPPIRESNLLLILGMILGIELVGLLFAALFGNLFFVKLAERLDTKRSILLALLVYSVIAVWGFFLNSTIEFWFLAWMVAIVQGGSQALSRSLYAYLSPASKSGEFFGLFGVMEKFSAMIGPLFFAAAGAIFGSSRPAILSIIAFFILGGLLLASVNVQEGRRIAEAEDEAYLKANTGG